MQSTNMEQRILDAARELFFEHGLAATSTTDIAHRAGCNQALVHYYYRTKEKLFQRIFLEQVNQALITISESLKSDLPFEELITKCIDMYFNALNQNRRLPFFVLNELVNNPERRAFIRDNFVSNPAYILVYERFTERLKAEQQTGELLPIEPFDLLMHIVALTVMTFSTIPMYQDLLSRNDDEVNDFIEHRKQEITRIILMRLGLKTM